ncbi:MAG: NifB/NifX family molybdenum-iron cluster-binding protein [Nitrospirae bacterium]|nr:NifB/NifX family molybdenum-iron cluster-binding protein [Nitrospirota bacterium]
MKICISSQGNSLDSEVDPRFGRCQYFIIVDTETMEFEAIKNPNIDAMGGAGIQSGQFVVGKKVKAVLTGNVGPNAFQTLNAAGLDVITGVSGSIKEAIEKYNKGDYKTAKGPTSASHSGMPASK